MFFFIFLLIYRLKQVSLVWKYFEKNLKNLTARCILCNKSIKHCGNTSNMKQHLTRKHEILWSANHRKNDTSVQSDTNILDKTKEKKIYNKVIN